MKLLLAVIVLTICAVAQNQTVTCTPIAGTLSCDNGQSATTVGNSFVITSPIPSPVIDTSFLAHPAAPVFSMPQIVWFVPAREKPYKARFPKMTKQQKAYQKCADRARTTDERLKCQL